MKRVSGKGKGRLNRSRGLERHENRVERFSERQLKTEIYGRTRPWGKPIPPCLDCGSAKRAGRRPLRGCWAPLCISCWIKRGKPSVREIVTLAKAKEEEKRAQAEIERQRAIDAGERPW